MRKLTLGVLADTHIPDRAERLPPILLESFRARGVAAILHAGDICIPAVLKELEAIAPVHAVRGNRDIFYLRHLPTRLTLNLQGVSVGLIHGHGSLRHYLLDRLRYQLQGLDLAHFKRRVQRSFPDCQIVVFGHVHYPLQEWIEGQLIFNPGSACCPVFPKISPSAGFITLGMAGEIETEIFYLT